VIVKEHAAGGAFGPRLARLAGRARIAAAGAMLDGTLLVARSAGSRGARRARGRTRAALGARRAGMVGTRYPPTRIGSRLLRHHLRHLALEIDAGLIGQLLAQLVAQHARLHRLDAAHRQVAKLERAVADANQPVDLEAERAEHILDFAILALS